ncbi:MAG: 4Fe-4S dicluster domain-containing protein [bacterium]|nr:4Fe-4S dicluster domain-containing protein [bacterium]
MFELRYLPDVVSLELNEEQCNGCGRCLEVCPHEVFSLNARKAFITDKGACMECGACALNCPTEAITVEAGVGCAAAVINGAIKGTGSDCGSSTESSECCG